MTIRGTCQECCYWHKSGQTGECRRWPPKHGVPAVTTYPNHYCGEWGEVLVNDDDLMRRLIPEEVLEEIPWLLDKVPQVQKRMEYRHKNAWSYAFHLYKDITNEKLYSKMFADSNSTLYFLNKRTEEEVRKRGLTEEEAEATPKAEWLLKNREEIFPSLFEEDNPAREGGVEGT